MGNAPKPQQKPPPKLSDILFTFLILGDFGVGKTKLAETFTGQTDVQQGQSQKTVKLQDGREARILVWDPMEKEQENKTNAPSSYWRCVEKADHCSVVVVFDVNKPETFESLSNYFASIGKYGSKGISVWVVMNKSDLTKSTSQATVEAFVEKMKKAPANEGGPHNVMGIIETQGNLKVSADDLFGKMIDHLVSLNPKVV